jgi:large subunit ribosomal protein L10e
MFLALKNHQIFVKICPWEYIGGMIKETSVGWMLGVDVMARKPASMYRRLKGPAYTRRKFIGGVPNNRILSFHSGNRRAAETGGFSVVLELRADNDCQIRHTALEAARVISNSTIRNEAGPQGYALRIHTYPHHVLRENKQATGAGADRVSQGMRCAFGKNVGTAARVKRGQRVISIHVDAPNYLTARDALRKASMKFPTPCTVRLIRGHEHLKGLI